MTHTTAAATALERLSSIDPATGEVVGMVETTPIEAIPGLVSAAAIAQRAWGRLSPTERAEILAGAEPRLRESIDELGTLVTR